ncbi:hypothetical protein BC829DRAFT_459269 [Chytridium lagenaria]|nr:hypothetical protein BC829DRAFT_459269 [Chytridium lagenaria]
MFFRTHPWVSKEWANIPKTASSTSASPHNPPHRQTHHPPHFHTTILIRNLQDHIDTERAYMKAHSFRIDAEIKAGNLSVLRDFGNAFNDYQALTRLEGVERVSVGKAFWGEEIVGFKFGRGGKHVVFSGGMHAREWIGPAMVAWLTHFLVTKPEATHLLDLFTFHVIPVVNVEGYRYTRSKDRLWRKTLQPNPGVNVLGRIRIGIGELVIYMDFAWSGEGSHPFSAPESLSLSTYMLNLQRTTSNNVISYIDFHSYSQLWMYPNSYTCDTSKMIKERDRVHRAAEEAVMALKRVGGTTFQYGDGCNTIYVASGTSIDWAYYVARIPYTYVVELRDRNQWGFALPASEIVPRV